MKKLFLSLALIMMAIPAFAADQKESAYDRVMRTNILRCGYNQDPIGLRKDPNTGTLSGMDYEVWETIVRHLDLKIEWVEASGWGTIPEDLRSGRYDAYCVQVWVSPPRTKYLTMSIPVAYSFLDAYVRQDDTRFDQNPDAINAENVTLPVVDGDVTEYMAKSTFPKAKRLGLPNTANWQEAYMSLTGKKADVLLIDPASYAAVSAANPVKLRKLVMPPIFTFASYYAYNKGEFALRDTMDTVLRMLIDSGAIEKIIKANAPDMTPPARNYAPVKDKL